MATHPETERKVLAELAAAGLPVNGDMTAALRALEAGGPDMLQASKTEGWSGAATRAWPAPPNPLPSLLLA